MEQNAQNVQNIQNLQQLTERLTLMYQLQQQQAATIQDLRARVAEDGPDRRFRLTFNTYSGEGGDPSSDFDAFEQNVRDVVACMRYPFPGVCHAILSSLRGKAAKMTTQIPRDFAQFQNLDGFLGHLRALFVSSSYRESAMAQYLTRTQKPREPLLEYHSVLRTLYLRAYQVGERAEAAFIRHFISGIDNQEIQKELIRRERTFQNSDQALQAALAEEGHIKVFQLSTQRKQFASQLATQAVAANKDDGPVPMEIGNVNVRGTNRDNRGSNKGYQRNSGNQNKPQNQNRQTKDRKDTKNKPKIAKDECAECHGKGHWARECPSKTKRLNAQKKNKSNNGQNRRGNKPENMQVGNVNPPTYEQASSEPKNA